MADEVHHYAARVIWDGNTGEGTARYTSYGRRYRVLVAGKPDLWGTADPAFRGEPGLHNPEELFVAAISACHMLFYLSLCARQGVCVVGYEDEPRGSMRIEPNGGGRFDEVVLNPSVTIADADKTALATALHDTAHELCFIANSCRVPIRHQPTVHCRSES